MVKICAVLLLDISCFVCSFVFGGERRVDTNRIKPW